MEIFIKVEDGRIGDVRFRTFGCGAAIATSSITTEMVRGKTLEEALALSRDAVAEALGGLPPHKLHCSNLAADALHQAIEDYYEKHPEAQPAGWQRFPRPSESHAEHEEEAFAEEEV